jgi:hypothetical protein
MTGGNAARVTHRSIRARLLARASEVETALASIDEASNLAGPTGLSIIKAEVALDRAHVLLDAGRAAAARASAEDALHRYRAKEHEIGARAAWTCWGGLRAACERAGSHRRVRLQ